jgi:hypothetical protein
MRENDRQYLERRVTEELHCAEKGACPEAVRAHYQLLGYYLDQLYAIEDEPEDEEADLAA